MKFMSKVVAGAALFSLAGAGASHAHHAMDGEMPSTLFEGFVSGLAHPVIGLDHLAFIVAAGVIAGVLRLDRLAPVGFVAASIAGVLLHLALIDLPAVEVVIALSVVVAGGMLALSSGRIPGGAWIALFVLAGIFHGYAYGESIVGAETTPLVAYLVGLFMVQSAIAVAAYLIATGKNWLPQALEPRLAGAAVFGVGLSALVGQVVG